MEIRQIEYFRTIAEAGTISAAARELHMTQPPLSYQMKMLEEELQTPLFLRGTKGITLTEAGKTLYEQADKLLTLADLTKREVMRSGQTTILHIGMTPSTVSLMSEHLLQFARQHPNVHFDIHEGSSFELKRQLENGTVDVTTLRTPIMLNGCETHTIATERLLAMAITNFAPLQSRNELTLQELSEQPLILSKRYRKYMLTAFEQAGLAGDIFCSCEDARTAITLAEMGLGVAILPAGMMLFSPMLHGCAISDTDLTTEILLAWRKERQPTEVQYFLELFGITE